MPANRRASKSVPNWLSKKALLQLHEESLATFGGATGIRDEELLDSALARAQNVHIYRPSSTISDLAAAYAYGLAKNHAFVDGNRRALSCPSDYFSPLTGANSWLSQRMPSKPSFAVAAGDLDERGLSQWIEVNSVSRVS
jgi:death-on-curing protein